MSAILAKLLPTARRLVTPELCSGQLARYEPGECDAFLAPCERDHGLAPLDEAAAEALARFKPGEPAADAFLAVHLHRALPLTRREAADPGVFRYLAVVRHPALVRHRWEYRTFASAHGRFWRAGTRHDSNAFSRWWWIAELTRQGDDYSLTHRVLERSALGTFLFSRDLSSHLPCVRAVVEVLEHTPGPRVPSALENLGKLLSVRVLEALPDAELKELVERALRLAEAE